MMLRFFILIAPICALGGCGTYKTKVLYEPSTERQVASFNSGDACVSPSYGFGTISDSPKALVFVKVRQANDRPELNLDVTITGNSRFQFVDSHIDISELKSGGKRTAINIEPFRFSTGGGRYVEKTLAPMDEFTGPPQDSFQPYYSSNKYAQEQWSFESRIGLPSNTNGAFQVQIPDAIVDGRHITFPRVSFQKREVRYRELCLK